MGSEKTIFKEVDVSLLKKLSSPAVAGKLINKFEKYYGEIPKEGDFYGVYQKYAKCEENYGKVFDVKGRQNVFASNYLNFSPKLRLAPFKLLENYLFSKKIINEKFY